MEHKPITGQVVIADASKCTPEQFMEHFFGPYEPKRLQTYEKCIRAILRGDTYGWPPMMVEHCQKLIAERQGIRPIGDGWNRVSM